jgi:hypothetical protein
LHNCDERISGCQGTINRRPPGPETTGDVARADSGSVQKRLVLSVKGFYEAPSGL